MSIDEHFAQVNAKLDALIEKIEKVFYFLQCRSETTPMAREVIGGLYTSWELIELLGIPPQMVSRWRQSGGGPPFVRIGKRAYYRLVDIRQWIDSLPPEKPRSPTEK